MAENKNELIGAARCICGSDKAKLSLSGKSKLVYLTCSACQLQIFARSGRSDEALRGLLVDKAPPAPAAKPKDDAPPPPPAKKPADEWDPYA